jgi:alcohol oxidase
MDAKNDTHGHDGPMQVSAGWSRSTLAEEYISVAKSRGIEVTDDIQDFSSESINKVSKWPKWINPIDGKRSDAATAFVHPILQTQSNLHLLLISKVVRVLFEGTRAVGVEFIPKYRPPKLSNQSKTFTTSSDETPRIARARKLVVLSSGSLATPQILQRSGVGDSSKLHSLGISNISDIPAVGMNYQDHPFIAGVASFTDAKSSDTGDDIIRATPETITLLEEQFIREKGGILSRNFIDAGIKLRPTDQEVSSLGIEFEKHWKQRFAGKPDKPLLTFLLMLVYFPPRRNLIVEIRFRGKFPRDDICRWCSV